MKACLGSEARSEFKASWAKVGATKLREASWGLWQKRRPLTTGRVVEVEGVGLTPAERIAVRQRA